MKWNLNNHFTWQCLRTLVEQDGSLEERKKRHRLSGIQSQLESCLGWQLLTTNFWGKAPNEGGSKQAQILISSFYTEQYLRVLQSFSLVYRFTSKNNSFVCKVSDRTSRNNSLRPATTFQTKLSLYTNVQVNLKHIPNCSPINDADTAVNILHSAAFAKLCARPPNKWLIPSDVILCVI